MMMDITNVKLEEVSKIMSKMDEMGMVSRIERKDDRFFLVLREKSDNKSVENKNSRSTLLDWCSPLY